MSELTRMPEPLPRTARWAIFGAFAVLVAVGMIRRAGDRPVVALAFGALGLALGTAAFFAPRRWLPAAAASASAAIAVVCNGEPSNLGWFAVVVLVAWAALSAPLALTAVLGVGTVLLMSGEFVFTQADPGWFSWMGGTAFAVIGCTFGRRQRDLLVQLREAQAGLAQKAQAEERNRIAREMHDVIAHSLTVSLLHVSSARLALADDPAEAERALLEAERLGRASLDEVRQAVGLVRDSAEPMKPLPGGREIAELVEQFRAAGVAVTAQLDRAVDAVPVTTGLAAYRIVQESLTNVAKHAPRAICTVHVAVSDDDVQLTVDSSGAPTAGSGLGLLGLRERADALGGHCEAGPGGSGWLVHAKLPLHAKHGVPT
jgi:signal transduction histidine kinase